MDNRMIDYALRAMKRQRIWRRALALLSAIVLLFTVNELKYAADTLERIPSCGMEEHSHDEACYDDIGALICGFEVHIHTDACYQERPKNIDADEIELEYETVGNVEALDVELPAEEIGEISLDSLDTGESSPGEEINQEHAEMEAAPAEIIDPIYDLNGDSNVLFSRVLASTYPELSMSNVDGVGESIYSDDQPLSIYVTVQDGDYLITAIRDFIDDDMVELCFFTKDGGVYIVDLKNGIEPVVDESISTDIEDDHQPAVVEQDEARQGNDDLSDETLIVGDVVDEEMTESEEVDLSAEDDNNEVSDQPEEHIEQVVKTDPVDELITGGNQNDADDQDVIPAIDQDRESDVPDQVTVGGAIDQDRVTDEETDIADQEAKLAIEQSAEPFIGEEGETDAIEQVGDENGESDPAEESGEDVADEGGETDAETGASDQNVEATIDQDVEPATDPNAERTADQLGESSAVDQDDEGDTTDQDAERTGDQNSSDTTDQDDEDDTADQDTERTVDPDVERTADQDGESDAANQDDEGDVTDQNAERTDDQDDEDYVTDQSGGGDSTDQDAERTSDQDSESDTIDQDAEPIADQDDEAEAEFDMDNNAHTVTIDVAGIAVPYSLNDLMAQGLIVETQDFDAEADSEEDTEAESEDKTEAVLTYDSDTLSIESIDGDYLITPRISFDSTTITFKTTDTYILTLVNYTMPAEEVVNNSPAQSFEAHTDGMVVYVNAEEGAFPADTTMTVLPIYDESMLGDIASTVEGEGTSVKRVHAVDITFRDAGGQEIEPLIPISVVIGVEELKQSEETVVVHMDNEGNTEVVEQNESNNTEVAFNAEAFSIYAVVVTERYITTPEGLTYRVKVTYDANANIPEGASLEVTEVGSESYLPQVIDLVGGKVKQARFFDITIMADGMEIQPDAPVTVEVTLEDASDAIRTVHFGEDAVTEVSSNCEEGIISFTAESFSVYGFLYTVDFDYTDEEGHTYTWKLNGGSAMLLSELFERLNIEADLTNSMAQFSDDMPEGLVELVPVTIDDVVADWQITSLAPFSTEHQLIVTLADGTVIIIGVTDLTYTDLRELLSSAILQDGDGNTMSEPWSVSLGQSYTLKLVFSETQEKQFVDDATPMTYALPDAISLGTDAFSTTFDIDMGDDGVLSGNTYSYDPGTNIITVVWNTSDPVQLAKLTSSNNAQFELEFNARFSSTEGQLLFSDTVIVDTNAYHLATISKEGEYDPDNGTINYTVTVQNEGNSSHVVVSDALSEGILDYVAGDIVTWTRTNGTTYTYEITEADVTARSFALSIGSMTDGESVTIRYASKVDYSKMTHPDVDNIYTHRGRLRSTEDETTNTATVSAENQADLSAEWKTDQIVVETMAKSGTWESVGDNIRRVKWTVIVNEEALVSMAGRTIVDKLSAANSGYTTYDTETPVRITVTDRIGNTMVRTIAWDNADDDFEYTSTATDDYWTYTFPSDDGCASYKFEYATLVDVTGMTNNPVIENSITNGYTVYGGVGVPAGSAKFGLQKAVDTEAAGNTTGWTEDYAYWKLTIKVPAVGSIEAHLCEVLPMVAYDGSYLYDELDKTYGTDGFIVEGLLEGESYTLQEGMLYGTDKYIQFDFYQDSEKTRKGFQASDAQRDVVIHLRTLMNKTWLDAYPPDATTPGSLFNHKNRGLLYVNNSSESIRAEANVTPFLVRPVKTGTFLRMVEVDGVKYPLFQYRVNFQGVKSYLDAQGNEGKVLYNGAMKNWFFATESFDSSLRYLDVRDSDDYAILQGAGVDMNLAERLLYNARTEARYIASEPGIWDESTHTLTFYDGVQIPRDPGNYSLATNYMYYYYMIVKDEAALRELERQTNQGAAAVSMDNTITYAGKDSSATVQFAYKPVDKTMVSYDDSSRKAHYRIVLNEAKDTLNGGKPMEMQDTYTNMSVDFESIVVTTDPASNRSKVSWNYSGYTGTFTIPDATKVVIEYDAMVLGETGQDVTFTNTASLLSYSDNTETSKTLTTSGSGTSTNYKVRLFKFEKGDMSKGLAGAVFQLYEADEVTPVTFQAEGTSPNAWTYSDGTLTHEHGVGDPVYFVSSETGYTTIQLDQSIDGVALNKSTRYFLIERVAPENYELSTIHWSFRIEDTADYNQYIYFNNDVLTVPNEPILDKNVVLKKVGVDSVTGEVLSDHLGGAVFTIYADDVKTTVAKGTVGELEVELSNLTSSADDGVFFNGTLPVGTYYIHETAAPDGYNLLVDDVIMQVTAEGVTVSRGGTSEVIEPQDDVYSISIKNYAGYSLPSTGGSGTTGYTVVGAGLILIAMMLLIRKRKWE